MFVDPEIKLGNFFNAGFDITQDAQQISDKTYLLNGLIENLFDLRFDREIKVLEQPQIITENRIEFSCELSSYCSNINYTANALLQAHFAFEKINATQHGCKLVCTDIMDLRINDGKDNLTYRFADWADPNWEYNLAELLFKLKRCINRFPFHMSRIFERAMGSKLEAILEKEMKRNDRTKHHYYAALVELSLDGATTEHTLLMSAINLKDAGSSAHRKAVLYALADHYNMHHAEHFDAVCNLEQGLTLDEYAGSGLILWHNLKLKSPAGYNSAKIIYVNHIGLEEYEKLAENIFVQLKLD